MGFPPFLFSIWSHQDFPPTRRKKSISRRTPEKIHKRRISKGGVYEKLSFRHGYCGSIFSVRLLFGFLRFAFSFLLLQLRQTSCFIIRKLLLKRRKANNRVAFWAKNEWRYSQHHFCAGKVNNEMFCVVRSFGPWSAMNRWDEEGRPISFAGGHMKIIFHQNKFHSITTAKSVNQSKSPSCGFSLHKNRVKVSHGRVLANLGFARSFEKSPKFIFLKISSQKIPPKKFVSFNKVIPNIPSFSGPAKQKEKKENFQKKNFLHLHHQHPVKEVNSSSKRELFEWRRRRRKLRTFW